MAFNQLTVKTKIANITKVSELALKRIVCHKVNPMYLTIGVEPCIANTVDFVDTNKIPYRMNAQGIPYLRVP